MPSQVSNVSRNLEIAEDHLLGLTQPELSTKYSLSQAQISRILNTDDCIRAVLQSTTKKLSLLSPKVYTNYSSMLDDTDDRPIQLKATQDIARIVGILPTHTSNQFILNIMQANVISADPSALAAIMGAVGGNMIPSQGLIDTDPDVIDVEEVDKPVE